MTWKILFIVFFFGFCIFIHEFGHLLAALWQGLYVEKFSVGFGKKLWGFKYKGVEFVVSCLPFGGYVSLPQLDPSDTPMTSDNKPLKPAKPWSRAVAAFAGPFFNVLFGFVLGAVMWGVGMWEAPPSETCMVTSVPRSLPLYAGGDDGLELTDEITAMNGTPTDKFLEELCEDIDPYGGDVTFTVLRDGKSLDVTFSPEPNPEWEAGLRKGDRIIAVNGKHFTRGREELANEYVYNDEANITLTVIRDGKQVELTYSPEPNPLMEGLGMPFFGMRNPLALGGVREDSPAAKADLQAGDLLLEVDDTNIYSGKQLAEALSSRDNNDGTAKPFSLLISRNGKEFRTPEISCPSPCSLRTLGIHLSILVSSALKDKPAYAAGMRRGDRILTVDEHDVMDSTELTSYIKKSDGRPMNFTVLRDGKTIPIDNLKAEQIDQGGKNVWVVGVILSDSAPKVIAHPNPWHQFTKIVTQTGRTLGLLFSPITSRISGHARGKASVKVEHMSGPLGIIMMLWYSLKTDGLRGGLALIILITYSLAIMNLLPIPVLDGGHIMFAAIEGIIRRRLPVRLVMIVQNVFAFLLIGLILYITFFDGRRFVRLFRFGSTKGQPPKTEQVTTPNDTPAEQQNSPAESPN